MGGMVTILKVREGMTSYEDPGWYRNPEGTVASSASKEDLMKDLGKVPKVGKNPDEANHTIITGNKSINLTERFFQSCIRLFKLSRGLSPNGCMMLLYHLTRIWQHTSASGGSNAQPVCLERFD